MLELQYSHFIDFPLRKLLIRTSDSLDPQDRHFKSFNFFLILFDNHFGISLKSLSCQVEI